MKYDEQTYALMKYYAKDYDEEFTSYKEAKHSFIYWTNTPSSIMMSYL